MQQATTDPMTNHSSVCGVTKQAREILTSARVLSSFVLPFAYCSSLQIRDASLNSTDRGRDRVHIMADSLGAPPVLSTPDTHILNDALSVLATQGVEKLSDEQLGRRYEIRRTIDEIRENKWRRIALQFPDEMLPHSARVYQLLARGLKPNPKSNEIQQTSEQTPDDSDEAMKAVERPSVDEDETPIRLTILADTSYGSCCVDEIAAEHVDADAVVHYGRSCLSPTVRLPVLYVYTKRELEYDKAINSFREAFPDQNTKVIITADVPYSDHIENLCYHLLKMGYTNIFAATIIHNPASSIPNRTVPSAINSDLSTFKDWHLFHISEPPTSLLLTLTSSMASIKVFPTSTKASVTSSDTLARSTSLLLRRRYALVTSLSTVSVWGILINTLSVKNYLHMVEHVKKSIEEAGKKSYLFVVGKINVTKVSNFSEIGGWVVIGCWESSLIDSKEFYRPIIAPFELELALQDDEGRVWTGEWRSDFESVFQKAKIREESNDAGYVEVGGLVNGDGNASDEESDEAPEFDLRTGRYVSKTRPMGRKKPIAAGSTNGSRASTALTKRANGDVIAVNGVASPAAQFLAERRTWKGLGSDFEVKYEEDEEEEGGSLIEEGRTGIAGGYAIGESERI